MAGASTGVAYPLALRTVRAALAVGRGHRLADLGAGLGGASQWLSTTTGAAVVSVEPSAASADAAARLFPELRMVVADAMAVPITGSSCHAVTLLGVVSLVDDLAPLLEEAVRLLRPGGRLGLTDLCLVDGDVERPGGGSPNTFRSMDVLVDALTERGLDVERLAATDADVDAAWDGVGREVDDEIRRRHGDDPEFERYRDDRRRLAARIEDGALHVGTLVARVRAER